MVLARREYRPVLATGLAGLVGLLGILAGCASPTTPHWSDSGVHAVDGYWILAEQPCDLSSSSECIAAVHTAESKLGIDPSAVKRAATAGLPRTWVRADGQAITVLDATSGSPSEFVVVDLADDTAAVDDRFVAVFFLQFERFKDGGPGGAHVGLRLGMDFEHPVEALDDLHAGGDLRAFQSYIGDAVNLHARRNLDEQRGLPRNGQETLRDGREERRHLRLQAVQKYV